MMNDNELHELFPFGALLIPAEEDSPAVPVSIGQDWEEEDFPEFFHAWRSPERDILLSRDLVEENDGYRTKNGHGDSYFMRPLTEDKAVKF